MDISDKAIEYGMNLLEERKLVEKAATLIVNKDLNFNELDKKYDFIIAQSVFTHLPKEYIEECFENLHKIMNANSKFYFTCNYSDKEEKRGILGFFYPFEFFSALAAKYNYTCSDISSVYKHPLGQNMIVIQLQ